MSHVSDSDHRRLEAKVFPDHCVVESHEISDASRGLRRVPVTKVWRTERLLGRGGFGEVHLQSQETEKEVKRALKIIPTRGMKLSHEECQRELTAMIEFTKPKYRNAAVFVDFIGWFQNDDAMFLAMEYMPLGDLEQNLQEIENSPTHNGPPLSEEEVQVITRQILEGLKIMHAEGFAHRDLKPQNVFVVQKQPQWWVKLGDFGLSKKRTEGTAYRTQAGTQQYMAPELFYYVQELDTETSEYTNAIDLWSLGCIVYRVLNGAVPFPSLLSLRNYCRDPSKVTLNIPPAMEEARRFVENLLMPHPAKRPVASTALESTWLIMKNKPKIVTDNAEVKLATLDISQSQNNYNTVSHKGLQSYLSLPTMNDAPTDTTAKGSTTEPLPASTDGLLSKTITAQPRSQPQDENRPSNVTGTTIKPNPRPKSPPASLKWLTSQQTPPTATMLPDRASPKAGQRSLLSAQFQLGQGHVQPLSSLTTTSSKIPRGSPEPPPLTTPPAQSYSDSTEVKRLLAPRIQIVESQNPDTGRRAPNDPGIAEVIPVEPQGIARAGTEFDKPLVAKGLNLRSANAKGNGNLMDIDGLDPATSFHKRKPRSIIGEVVPDLQASELGNRQALSGVVDAVTHPAKAGVPEMKHLPPIDRRPSGPRHMSLKSTRIYPPGTQSEREKLQDSDIKAILTSHGITPQFTSRSQLLATLNKTFPVSAAPGRQFYYWDFDYSRFYYDHSCDSLPRGWEARLSTTEEICYYNTVDGIYQWDDPRTEDLSYNVFHPFKTEPDTHVNPRSNPVLVAQKTSQTQVPPSIPTPMESYLPGPDLPEGWAAEFVRVSPEKPKCWRYVNTITGAIQYSLPNKSASAEDGAVSSAQAKQSSFEERLLITFWKALYDFDAQQNGDLRLSKGDLIRVFNAQLSNSPQDGWLLGEINGRKGVFPANFCLRVVWMKALFDFDPVLEGDLRLSAGDLIRIINVPCNKVLPDGWLVGEVNGRNGMFPANYSEQVVAAPGQETDGSDGQTHTAISDSYVRGTQSPSIASKDQILSFIPLKEQDLFMSLFKLAVEGSTSISRETVRDIMAGSGLGSGDLSHIWSHAHFTASGRLSFPEFALAMYLCNMRLHGVEIPIQLPKNIKTEIRRAIPNELTTTHFSRQFSDPPDFKIRIYPLLQGFIFPRIDFLAQHALFQPRCNSPDPCLQQPLSPPPYGSTIIQDDAKSNQPKQQVIVSNLLGASQPLIQENWILVSFVVSGKSSGRTTFRLRISRQDTIYEVKRKVREQEGYLIREQSLTWRERKLDDKYTVEHYNIVHGSRILLTESYIGSRPNK